MSKLSIIVSILIMLIVVIIITSVMIVTDNTPDSAYDMLAGKNVKEDWFNE